MKLVVYREHQHVERDPVTGRTRSHPDTVTWKVVSPPDECESYERSMGRWVTAKLLKPPHIDFQWLCKHRDLPNPVVLERRIAELAFPELLNINYPFPNRLPPVPWWGLPAECYKSETREVWVDFDIIPEEWLKQKSSKRNGPVFHVKGTAPVWYDR
jgi:hypothetical protein